MQRETATFSLNKIQKDNKDTSMLLHAKIQEMLDKLNEVIRIEMLMHNGTILCNDKL